MPLQYYAYFSLGPHINSYAHEHNEQLWIEKNRTPQLEKLNKN